MLATVFRVNKFTGKGGPHGELLFSLIQKKPAFVPDSKAFNSFIGDGFCVPELKGGNEASDGDEADNVSNVMRCCMSLDCMDLLKKSLSLLSRLGGGNGNPELPYTPGQNTINSNSLRKIVIVSVIYF